MLFCWGSNHHLDAIRLIVVGLGLKSVRSGGKSMLIVDHDSEVRLTGKMATPPVWSIIMHLDRFTKESL